VQVVCYELFIAADIKQTPKKIIGDKYDSPLASNEQMELFYEHLYQTLVDIDFMQPERSKSIMRRLRRIYNRVQLDSKEVDILRGILRLSQNHQSK
jgi:tRNA C32,U32 (ribose-2'-O)-methylase TrmJ